MMKLPLKDDARRVVVDGMMGDIIAVGTGKMRPATLREALVGAKRFMAAERAARSVLSIVRKADDALWIIEIGRRGGWRKIWELEAGVC